MIKKTVYESAWESPLGHLSMRCTEKGISELHFVDSLPPKRDSHYLLAEAIKWLEAYFAGRELSRPPLDLSGTDFMQSIWQELLQIPYGATVTYGAIAKRAGTSPRAAGGAIGRNPVCLIVPCHRVIGANGDLTGYGEGLERKAWLLKHENIIDPQQQKPAGKAP